MVWTSGYRANARTEFVHTRNSASVVSGSLTSTAPVLIVRSCSCTIACCRVEEISAAEARKAWRDLLPSLRATARAPTTEPIVPAVRTITMTANQKLRRVLTTCDRVICVRPSWGRHGEATFKTPSLGPARRRTTHSIPTAAQLRPGTAVHGTEGDAVGANFVGHLQGRGRGKETVISAAERANSPAFVERRFHERRPGHPLRTG